MNTIASVTCAVCCCSYYLLQDHRLFCLETRWLGQNRGSISRDDPVLLLVILVYANMSHFTLPYQCDQLHKARARPHRNCDGQYSCIALTSLQPSLQLPQAVAWHQTGELHCVRLWAGACPCSSQSSTKSVTLGRKGCVCARDYQHLDLKEPRHL